jgi:hypothetical protein
MSDPLKLRSGKVLSTEERLAGVTLIDGVLLAMGLDGLESADALIGMALARYYAVGLDNAGITHRIDASMTQIGEYEGKSEQETPTNA